MGAIRITPADKWFSMCVRERVNWTCERCGNYFPEGQDRRGIHCSHFHSRGKWSVRFDPCNAASLCYGCHNHIGGRPVEHRAFFMARLGVYGFDALQEAAEDASRGRYARKSVKPISTHYRKEFRLMQSLRMAGDTGRIEFVGWV